MAAFLFAALVTTTVQTSCTSNDDNPTTEPTEISGESFEAPEEPTDDQLEVKVTADMPTAVLSQFDENTVATALIKRLTNMVIKYNVGLATSMLEEKGNLSEMIDHRAEMLGIESYTIKWFTNDAAVNKRHDPIIYTREIGKK